MKNNKIESLKEYMLLHFQVTPENIDEKLQELKDKIKVKGEWQVNEK